MEVVAVVSAALAAGQVRASISWGDGTMGSGAISWVGT
jgi:hypothetical protein